MILKKEKGLDVETDALGGDGRHSGLRLGEVGESLANAKSGQTWRRVAGGIGEQAVIWEEEL